MTRITFQTANGIKSNITIEASQEEAVDIFSAIYPELEIVPNQPKEQP